MKRIIVIAPCEKLVSGNKDYLIGTFHFRGYWNGLKIKSLLLKISSGTKITEGEEYIVSVDVRGVNTQIMFGTIIKCRPLMDLFYEY